MATSPWQAPPPLPRLPPSHLTKPLREMISAWQSFTVSPFKLSSSPFTHRLPGGGGRGGNKREMEGLCPLKATTRALQEGLSSPGFTSLGF